MRRRLLEQLSVTRIRLFRFLIVLGLIFGAWHIARDHLGAMSADGNKCAYCVLGAAPSMLAAAPAVPVPTAYTVSWPVPSFDAVRAFLPVRRAIRGPPFA